MNEDKVIVCVADVAMNLTELDPIELEFSPKTAQKVVDQLASHGIRASVPTDMGAKATPPPPKKPQAIARKDGEA